MPSSLVVWRASPRRSGALADAQTILHVNGHLSARHSQPQGSIASHPLETTLDRLAAASNDVAALSEIARRARELILAAPVPAGVAGALTAAYRALGDDQPVAVRSSATAEDLPFASFAGQQDTYLNVVGADAVLDAVRRCWSSLWTDRAVAYRAANGIDPRTVYLAVVVQRMVDSALAG